MKKKKKGLEELLASMRQASEREVSESDVGEASSARRVVACNTQIDALGIKELRSRTKLTQSEFAALLGVELSTFRNWEQGRRAPTGPARALLRAIRNDPQNVIRALARAA
jgi:putative transcriptional regulator